MLCVRIRRGIRVRAAAALATPSQSSNKMECRVRVRNRLPRTDSQPLALSNADGYRRLAGAPIKTGTALRLLLLIQTVIAECRPLSHG